MYNARACLADCIVGLQGPCKPLACWLVQGTGPCSLHDDVLHCGVSNTRRMSMAMWSDAKLLA
jgi:hypothetical protein